MKVAIRDVHCRICSNFQNRQRIFKGFLLCVFSDIHVPEKYFKLFGLRVHGYRQFLAMLRHEFINLRCGNRLYTIFGCAQAKFSIYTIHGLRSVFGNVAPHISENPVCVKA